MLVMKDSENNNQRHSCSRKFNESASF